MPQKPLQYYTLAQAADYLGIHKNFLRVKMQNGEIKFDCLDGCNRPMFTRATLNQYIAQNQRRPIDKTDYIRDSTLRELLESLGPVSGLNLQASSTLATKRLCSDCWTSSGNNASSVSKRTRPVQPARSMTRYGHSMRRMPGLN